MYENESIFSLIYLINNILCTYQHISLKKII